MPIAISPHYNREDFPNGISPDQQIEVFVDQITGWQLGIAREMIRQNILHRHFAVLQIVTSYFETIAKYVEGYDQEGSSEEYFKKGILMVFPRWGCFQMTSRSCSSRISTPGSAAAYIMAAKLREHFLLIFQALLVITLTVAWSL